MSHFWHRIHQITWKHTQTGQSEGVSSFSKDPSKELPENPEKQGKARGEGRAMRDVSRKHGPDVRPSPPLNAH